MVDIKIVGGQIADGSGRALYRADVAVSSDKIVAIGDLTHVESRYVVDAAGKIVSPGFIDIHTHSDVTMLLDEDADSGIRCGVTTQITGNCGLGVAPLLHPDRAMQIKFIKSSIAGKFVGVDDFPWSNFAGYHDYIRKHPTMINMGSLIAHGAVRISEMGMSAEVADDVQTLHMRKMAEEGMEAGAFGMSSGLSYSPGDFVRKEEIAEIAKALAPYAGIYTSHIRNQAEGTFDSLEETLFVARTAQIPMHISHLKLASPTMWGKTDEVFEWFERVRASGTPATFDVYPYTRGASNLLRLLPPWSKEGGVMQAVRRASDPSIRKDILRDFRYGIPGWENIANNVGWQNIFLTTFRLEKYKECDGWSVQQIADHFGKDPYELYLDVLIEEEGEVNILVATMSTQDMETFMVYPGSIIISDGQSQPLSEKFKYGMEHPRVYGTQAKVLGEFVREKHVLTLEEAVKKMTWLPAELLGIHKRGKIEEGYYADITVFDPQTIADTATFAVPRSSPVGIEAVVVNGVLAFSKGVILDKSSGRLLTKN